ncbi:hypothetical protein AVEN_171311-1 [Araneus ventricosus]|uniref:Uncharacterized protein n=1 Tax=Araneus ventricosus TaxID=182803 RepID=A0A4Y2M7Q1_ARAVE|nr:hypothetical protein AVEN_171311-1 [Araneus ventricosus]
MVDGVNMPASSWPSLHCRSRAPSSFIANPTSLRRVVTSAHRHYYPTSLRNVGYVTSSHLRYPEYSAMLRHPHGCYPAITSALVTGYVIPTAATGHDFALW